jgi:hypothetical protein
MDIREYFQKEQKGFYRIIAENLTVRRSEQLYNAINEWHESELKLLGIGAVISRFSIEERFRLEEKLVKMVTDKRPYYKTVKKREVVRDTVSDLLDAIIQNGL